MVRVKWDTYFVDMVDVVRSRATCDRLAVGAVIVRDNNVLSTGYNGSPVGEEHCIDVGCYMKNGSCQRTIHAEMNAIMNSMKNGVDLRGSTIYVSHYPCYNCAKHIVQAGIRKVYYVENYRNGEDTKQLFENRDILVKQVGNNEGMTTSEPMGILGEGCGYLDGDKVIGIGTGTYDVEDKEVENIDGSEKGWDEEIVEDYKVVTINEYYKIEAIKVEDEGMYEIYGEDCKNDLGETIIVMVVVSEDFEVGIIYKEKVLREFVDGLSEGTMVQIYRDAVLDVQLNKEELEDVITRLQI